MVQKRIRAQAARSLQEFARRAAAGEPQEKR
jgi:hypothetical protein